MAKSIRAKRASVAAAVVALACAAMILNGRAPTAHATAPLNVSRANIPGASSIAHLPLAFEPNRGQADARAEYVAHASDATVFLTSSGAAVRALKRQATSHKGASPDSLVKDARSVSGYTVAMSLAGANPHAVASASDSLPGTANYFIGNNPKNWKTAIPTYAKIRYESVYPGIDLVYYGNRGQLEYDLIVNRGADPRAVGLKFTGADAVSFSAAGDAIIQVGKDETILRRPIGYQPGGPPVEVSYYKTGRDTLGLKIGGYDRNRELIIDPTLIYSTYLGDTFAEGEAVAFNSAGGAIVAGFIADGSSFPTTAGPFGPAAGAVNAVVSEFNSTGTALLYSAVVGGSEDSSMTAGTSTDEALGLAADISGDIYLTGFTTAIDFPTANTSITGGTALSGTSDAFVTELNTSTGIVYSTYLGGSGADSGNAIAVDGLGNAYVAGNTMSTDFPTTSANAFQATNPSAGAVVEGFVSQLAFSTDVSASYSTYFGEPAGTPSIAGGTILTGIAVDTSANAYVAGSAGAGFPFGGSLGNHTFGGTWDAIAGRINTTASGAASLVWASYVGGGGADWANAVTIGLGCSNNCPTYIAGATTSENFPTAVPSGANSGPVQTTLGGYADGFVTQLKGVNGMIAYSTYLGGESYDEVRGIAVDQFGNAAVTGLTQSASFPTVSASSAGLSSTLGSPSGGFFTSTNGGSTLTAVSGWSGSNGSIRSSSALTFDTSTVPATIYAGSTTGIWASTDGGATFTQPASTGLTGQVESLNFASAGLFAGTTTGLFLSNNDGASFSSLSGVSATDTVYQVGAVTQFTNYYTAATSNGFYVTANAGTSFTEATGIPSGTQAFAGVIDANSCAPLGSPTSCTIYVATDKGVYSGTLSSSSASLAVTQTSLNFAAVTALAADATTTPTTLYAATLGVSGVVTSTNGFSTVTSTAQYTTSQNALALALDTATSNPATVYAGAASQALTSVFASTNAGGTYSQGASEPGAITALQVLAGSPPTLYVGEYLQQDAFVTQLNGYGSAIGLSGYLGGTSLDVGNGIADDTAGNSYAGGSTFSTNFPTSGGAYQTSLGGGTGEVNAFVTDVNLGALKATPSSLIFGSIQFANSGATSPATTFKLTNTTTSTITFTAATTITGDFAITSDGCTASIPATLGPTASCTVAVKFTPTALGQRLGTIVFTDSASTSPTISLFGTGVKPPIKLNLTSLTFTKQTVGTTSAAKLVTITNTGSVGETITALSSSNSDFAVSGSTGGASCGSTPITLPTAGHCTIAVTFSPSTGTVETGTISVTDNALASPQKVSVTGTGAAVTITVTPNPLTFPARKVDTLSTGSVVTLKNTNPVVITLGSITISGANPSDFSDTTTCGASLAATTGSCTVTVKFKPLAIGTRTATLNVPNSAAAGPQSIALNGSGYATLTVAPAKTTFPTTTVGHTSTYKLITVTNTTSLATVTLSSFTTSAPFTIDMTHTTCSTSLAPSAACKIAVTFSPTATGTFNGVVTIIDNALGSPQQPELTGTGS